MSELFRPGTPDESGEPTFDKLYKPSAPRPSCHAVVQNQAGQIVLIQRGAPPYRGWWGFPGGAVELGETVEQALVREVFEETGLAVEVSRLLRHVDGIGHADNGEIQYHYVILFFAAVYRSGTLAAASDAAAAEWVFPTEADNYRLMPQARSILMQACGGAADD